MLFTFVVFIFYTRHHHHDNNVDPNQIRV